MTETIVPFEELAPEMGTSAGGKGGTLARLYQSGYPVPNGLVILPAAFTQHELGPDTLSAEVWARVQIHLARLRGDDPQAAPHEFSLSRPRGRYDGPAELKRFARRLYRLARRLEADPDRRDDVFDSHGLLQAHAESLERERDPGDARIGRAG